MGSCVKSINLIQIILEIRSDLKDKFGDQSERLSLEFVVWIINSGLKEYAALATDARLVEYLKSLPRIQGLTWLQSIVYLARADVREQFTLPRSSKRFIRWFWLHGVFEHNLIALLMPEELKLLKALVARFHSRNSPLIDAYEARIRCQKNPSSQRPFGVNLIGYPFAEIGIGEDLRTTARALACAGIPVAVVNFHPGSNVPQGDLSITRWSIPIVKEGPFLINIFCMTALETARFYAERGAGQWDCRVNVGYWPWELSRWPRAWLPPLVLVDEVWVSSQHIKESLLSSADGLPLPPVKHMPLVVESRFSLHRADLAQFRRSVRLRYRLPIDAKIFCFSFDHNSSIYRKNPLACVKAFLTAFPKSVCSERAYEAAPKVALLIKTHQPNDFGLAWGDLKRLAATDDRVHIIEQTLPYDDVLALYASCDAFLSLHRAEGFGRGIAEALQLGLHVVTTDYGGNTDFCRRSYLLDQVSLIPYRLIDVEPEEYPYADGQVWADPDIEAAAEAMRSFVWNDVKIRSVPQSGWPCFRAERVGLVYARRLKQLAKNFALKFSS